MKPTIQKNIARYNELLNRIPSYLLDKVIAVSDLKPLIVTEDDVEDMCLSASEIVDLLNDADEMLTAAEVTTTKYGF
jgi:hypothetical protein